MHPHPLLTDHRCGEVSWVSQWAVDTLTSTVGPGLRREWLHRHAGPSAWLDPALLASCSSAERSHLWGFSIFSACGEGPGQPPALARPDVGDAKRMKPTYTLCTRQDGMEQPSSAASHGRIQRVSFTSHQAVRSLTLHFFCFAASITTSPGRTQQGTGSRWRKALPGDVTVLG